MLILITGASKGIGFEMVNQFSKNPNNLIIAVSRNIHSLNALVKTKNTHSVLPLKADITKAAQRKKIYQTIQSLNLPLDILVNNAGITRDARLQKMTLDQFDAVIDVNLRAVFHASQAVAEGMIARGSGVILNASSVVGIYGNFGQTNYAASKFGVIGFTKTWSRELGPKGIRVNAVAPGFIDTSILSTIPEDVLHKMREQVPLGRLGAPEEVANVYAFLASDEASYINGAVIEVSGGMTL